MSYPPTILKDLVEAQNFSYNSVAFEALEANAEDLAEEKKYKIDNEFQEDQTLKKIMDKVSNKKGIFTNIVFFLSTEVPRTAFEFMITSCGGRTISDLDNFESEAYADSTITHVVTDRPPQSLNLDSRREYIQPQWVCDCVNNNLLLPLKEYGPGKPLPPHLSPFEEKKEGDYVPDREKELKKLRGDAMAEEEDESSGAEDEEEEDSEEEDYLEEEDKYEVETEIKNTKKIAKTEKKEDKDLRSMMLSKRKRRILERINYSKASKKDLVEKLKAKKKILTKSK